MFRTIDGVARSGAGLFLLLGRLAIGALFLPTGWSKLTNPAGFAHYLEAKALPGPSIGWAVAAGVVEFFATLAIVLGFKTRLAAAALCIFVLIAAYLGHPFWTIADPAAHQANYVNFWKNIVIAGGLLFLFVRGAGPLSLDRD